MNHDRRLALAVAAALAASTGGCSSDGPRRLADLRDLSIDVSWYYAALGQTLTEPHFSAQLGFQQGEEECATLVPTTSVTVDGDPMEARFLGGWKKIDSGTYCSVPTFFLSGDKVNTHPFEAATSFEISDGDQALRVDAQNLFVERSILLTSPADGHLVGGQEAAVAWTPATDVLDPLGVTVSFIPASATASGTPSYVLSGDQVKIEGNRVTFQVPETASEPGALWVGTNATVPIDVCDGFTRCAVGAYEVMRSVPTSGP